jgi:hypothetical protein
MHVWVQPVNADVPERPERRLECSQVGLAAWDRHTLGVSISMSSMQVLWIDMEESIGVQQLARPGSF